MAVKSLTDSYIFNSMNRNDTVNKAILGAINDGETIDLEKDLPDALLMISRNFKYAMKLRVMELYKSGKLILKMSPPHIKVPTSIPFVLFKEPSGNIRAIIFADLYTSKLKDGTYKTDAKKLYTMMEAAAVGLGYFANYRALSKNASIMSSGADIFSSMILRVLNKKFALIDKTKINSVLFISSKFYLISILGLDNSEQIDNYACKNIKNVNPVTINNINTCFKTEDYANLASFIQALANNELNKLGLQELTIRGFLEAFINTYDSAAALSLELFPYFCYNVFSVLNSAYINNQYVLEDMIVDTKQGITLYNALRQFI